MYVVEHPAGSADEHAMLGRMPWPVRIMQPQTSVGS